MNKRSSKKGFSLPEVIIAISMIVLVIVTATNLLVSSTRANRSNINEIIAYNLAQEAVEGMRNIRDGYWLHNQDWRGSKRLFGSNYQTDGYYVIEKNHNLYLPEACTYSSPSEFSDPNNVRDHAPWELTYIATATQSNVDNLDSTKLYKSGDSESIVTYSHNVLAEDFSGFRRWVEIESLPYDEIATSLPGELKIAITAVVEWEEFGKKQRISIPTVLTDWKSGPL